MTPEYREWTRKWLEDNNATDSGGYGLCDTAAKAMAEAFPALTVTKGHVDCPPPWFRRGHWWCVAPCGTIVDPTAAQFPQILKYEEYTPGDDVRLGRCMNCGDEIWGPDPDSVYSTCVCGEECSKVLEKEFSL